ncbi:signal peptidase I [Roseibium aquae]|uniref:Signal peptidase I n=1 Tax=Roseibium aquae TaxID=1323746 RepID=A0A916TLW8_9HYPH|nr:signal peptidase I [Roseibium aquae]GGB56428.1 signal peptidase I [Roseibium aquae]
MPTHFQGSFQGKTKRVSDTKKEKEGGLYETIKVIVQALLLALVVRTLLFQPFNIPSGSMKDTLLIGDYLFVSKYSYGYSRYSAPFGLLPFSGRIFSSEPERGDVAVFKLPRDNATDYIKRVIGLPGDTIQMIDGIVHINGTPVKRERIDDYIEQGAFGNVRRVPRYRETLPNGVTYDTLDLTMNGQWDNTRVYEVPEGHYFMLGDNRDNSVDSRVSSAVGPVPLENFIGRAEILFFSIEDGEPAWQIWKWPWTVRWDRIGKSL